MHHYYSIGKFSEMTGVTQRTLRYYDKLNLLQPSFVSEAGRRFYRESDLIPLQQIIALKYLGFSLQEIKKLIKQTDNLSESLAFQRQLMVQKQEHLTQVIKAMDHTINILSENKELDPLIMAFLISSILTEKENLNWMKTHFPKEIYEHIISQFPEKELEWNAKSIELFERIKLALKKQDPHDEEVQHYLQQMILLLEEMLGEQLSAIQQLEIDEDDDLLPAFISPFTKQEEILLGKAFEIYYKKKEVKKNGDEKRNK
ncbi:MerR family transcriptional regulator [Bacillus chungangensis]|uniref:DNA-binding transcriptional MerR regulator n=1 Tax=Bacillus chungangensis TaxID=587633 RepID=A0ABT9WV99_9BACI|nr:MerR family transcriptional regulator [Bacillus chungangensis]MDQ0177232.1 DNA-binding transcriptional MerR regulator [Bacillus chungangensis]